VAAAVVFVALARLFVSWHVIGTNDIVFWERFAELVRQAGPLGIYASSTHYNHPPLVSWFLLGIGSLGETTGMPLPFLLRSAPILADAGSVFVIWHLLRRRHHPYAFALTLICCLNPVSFLVTSYHGNTDPLFIFFVLLAVLLAESGRAFGAGLVLGLSLCVKTVPVMFVPFFWFWFRGMRERGAFAGGLLLFPLAVFLPALVHVPVPFVNNVLRYSGIKGIWGVSHVLFERMSLQGLLWRGTPFPKQVFDVFVPVVLYLYACLNVLCAWRLSRRRLDLVQGCFLAAVLFLVLTPGFGIQYLFWACYFAVLCLPVLGTAWVILAGCFLLGVYGYWGGLGPPYYADSYRYGPWAGWNRVFDLGLWALLFVLLSAFSKKTERVSGGSCPGCHGRPTMPSRGYARPAPPRPDFAQCVRPSLPLDIE
jgi:Gpi18-like mannosyltransferase